MGLLDGRFFANLSKSRNSKILLKKFLQELMFPATELINCCSLNRHLFTFLIIVEAADGVIGFARGSPLVDDQLLN